MFGQKLVGCLKVASPGASGGNFAETLRAFPRGRRNVLTLIVPYALFVFARDWVGSGKRPSDPEAQIVVL
jgi:hypothetical protein